jgi:PAS domain S-box-containing protein
LEEFLNKLFSRRYFSERILFLAITGGMLLDGWMTAVFREFSGEALLRIIVSVLAAGLLAATYLNAVSRQLIRRMAYGAIVLLLTSAAILNIIHHFDFDNALTFIGIYIICSLYFRTISELVFYLGFGLLLVITAILLVEDPHLNATIFVFRFFLAGLLVLILSYATRRFQEQVRLFSQQVSEENESLRKTKLELEERLSSEHLLALVASRANTSVIISDAKDVIEWVNAGFTGITGYSLEEARGKNPSFLRGPDTDPQTIGRIEEKKNKREPFHETILNYRKNGSPVWIHMHVTPLLDASGKVERYIAIQEDITESKTIEAELRFSREQLKLAQRQAKIGSWEWHDGSETIFISGQMAQMLGLPGWKHAPIALVMERIHPDDVDVLRKTIETVVRRTSPFEIDIRLKLNDTLRYVYITGQAIGNNSNRRTERLFGTMQDITERKQIEEELRLAEQQYRSLFEHSQHMICMHDLNGVILSINPAGAHAIGYQPEEIIGRDMRSFFYVNAQAEYDEYMDAIRTKGSTQGVLRMRVRGGNPVVWLYNNVLLTGPRGNPFVLSSNVEITSRFEMEKELRRTKKLAEEALVMKDRFVANISHELRTPMNAIVGFTELLMKTKLSDEQIEYIQAVHIAGNNLTTMINDVLDIAKIEAGKIEFEARPFSIRNVMSDTHRLLSQTAAQSGLQFEWKCADHVPVYVLGDDLRLTQILINLVGNAVKFTEKGFVNFSATVISETSESLDIEFMVEDSGIGIAEEKVQAIFEPFTQGSAESTRKYGGTGLGLSIVRDLVELQGGMVSVKSAVGIGSTFTFNIPYKKVSVEVIQEVEQALQPVESPGPLRVLLVEDQPLNQQLAKKLVHDFGFTAEIAVNGKAAIDMLRNDPEPFDLVLMDLQMPEMDGYDATRVIREKMHSDIPIIALTAHSSAGEREKCLALGMNGYLVKPFRAQELYFRIASVIRKKHVEPEAPVITGSGFEQKPLHALAAGDQKFEREMLELLIRSIPEDFEAIVNGVETGDFEKLRTTSHRLKSSVALAGDRIFADQLEEMNKLAHGKAQKNVMQKLVEEMQERLEKLNVVLREDLASMV